jgi:CRP-like cAMP-binding protein
MACFGIKYRYMEQAYKQCALFQNISDQDIEELIRCSGSQVKTYEKGEYIFDQYEEPKYMHILLEGDVSVGKDYADGKESHMTDFTRPGEIFGEILLFLGKETYDFYARANAPTRVLRMPRMFFTTQCARACGFHAQLNQNLLSIFARKAFFLQNRVQILSGASLRIRIAKTLLMNEGGKGLHMTREDMAGFVNAARPSVSREISATCVL